MFIYFDPAHDRLGRLFSILAHRYELSQFMSNCTDSALDSTFTWSDSALLPSISSLNGNTGIRR